MNDENLKPFKKGDDPRRNINGRPVKFVSTLRKSGFKRSEINEIMEALLDCTEEELNDIASTVRASILERILAKELLRDITEKDKNSSRLSTIQMILDRAFGKSSQSLDVTSKGESIMSFIPLPNSMGFEDWEKYMNDINKKDV